MATKSEMRRDDILLDDQMSPGMFDMYGGWIFFTNQVCINTMKYLKTALVLLHSRSIAKNRRMKMQLPHDHEIVRSHGIVLFYRTFASHTGSL